MRLPREKFYQNFADLYRQRNTGPYYELVRAGKMTIEDCRRGKTMLDTLATWERYAERGPIPGRKSRHRIDPLPSSPLLETSYATGAGRNLRSPAPR